MPISMCERSAKGTSLVTSSHSNTAKLHISADRRLMSSGFFCKAGKIGVDWLKVCFSSRCSCTPHGLMQSSEQSLHQIIQRRICGAYRSRYQRGLKMAGGSGREVPSGAIHAGEYMRPGHWKENLASAMLILAVMSSSIWKQLQSVKIPYYVSSLPEMTKVQPVFLLLAPVFIKLIRIIIWIKFIVLTSIFQWTLKLFLFVFLL